MIAIIDLDPANPKPNPTTYFSYDNGIPTLQYFSTAYLMRQPAVYIIASSSFVEVLVDREGGVDAPLMYHSNG